MQHRRTGPGRRVAYCPRDGVSRRGGRGARGQGGRRCPQPHHRLPARIAGRAKPADPGRQWRARGRIPCADRGSRCGHGLRQPAGRPHPRAGRPDRCPQGRGGWPAVGGPVPQIRGGRPCGRRWHACRPHRLPTPSANWQHRRRAAQDRPGHQGTQPPAAAQAGSAGTVPQTPAGRARARGQPAHARGVGHREPGRRTRRRTAPELPGARPRLAAQLPRHAGHNQGQRADRAPGPGGPEQWRRLEQCAAAALHRPAPARHAGALAPAVDSGRGTATPTSRRHAHGGHGSCSRRPRTQGHGTPPGRGDAQLRREHRGQGLCHRICGAPAHFRAIQRPAHHPGAGHPPGPGAPAGARRAWRGRSRLPGGRHGPAPRRVARGQRGPVPRRRLRGHRSPGLCGTPIHRTGRRATHQPLVRARRAGAGAR